MADAGRYMGAAGSPRVPEAGQAPAIRRLDAGRKRVSFGDFFAHRRVLNVIASRDLRARYMQSVLGPAWLVIQPFGLLIGLLVGFASALHVKTNGVPYPLFALCGLSAWSYFQAALTAGSNCFILNAVLIQRTPAPRIAFPSAALISTLPSLFFTVAAALIWSGASGRLAWRIVLLPVGMVWLLILAAGAVLIFSSLAVFFRDIANATPFVLQVGVFLAPIGYPLSHGGGLVATVLRLNPLTGTIELFRTAMISGYSPDVTALVFGAAAAAVLLAVGWYIFSRVESAMADVI